MNYKLLALLLCYSLFSCQANPVRRSATPETLIHGEEMRRLDEVNCARQILKYFTQSYSLQFRFPLGYKVLCKTYDQYTYIRDNVEFPPPIDRRDASNLLLQSLHSSCQWVLLKDNTTLSGCSLSEIGQACAAYRFYEPQNLTMEFNEHVKNSNTPGQGHREPEISKFLKTKFAINYFCPNLSDSKIEIKAACTCPQILY